ncbi:MAG: hypothetical protein II453_09615 [Alphaproteobacteria bacterium]|nr:hypothetical protein [Alphaproteobacteria bacterium]
MGLGDASYIYMSVQADNETLGKVLPIIWKASFGKDAHIKNGCIEVSRDNYYESKYTYSDDNYYVSNQELYDATNSVEAFKASWLGKWIIDICRALQDGTLHIFFYHDGGCPTMQQDFVFDYANGVITAKYYDFDIECYNPDEKAAAEYWKDEEGGEPPLYISLREYTQRTGIEAWDIADNGMGEYDGALGTFFSSPEYQNHCGSCEQFRINIADMA